MTMNSDINPYKKLIMPEILEALQPFMDENPDVAKRFETFIVEFIKKKYLKQGE